MMEKIKTNYLRLVVFAMALITMIPNIANSDSIVGKWIFEPEGSLYRMRFYFIADEILNEIINSEEELPQAFFPAEDVFQNNPEALLKGSTLESTTLVEIDFMDEQFISLHYKDGHILRGLYSLYLFYDSAATGFTDTSLKIWKLAVIDSEKEELDFFLRQKPQTNTVQMTYQTESYIIHGTLNRVDGKTIFLDAYEKRDRLR